MRLDPDVADEPNQLVDRKNKPEDRVNPDWLVNDKLALVFSKHKFNLASEKYELNNKNQATYAIMHPEGTNFHLLHQIIAT